MKYFNLKIIFVLVIALIYFSFALLFIYTTPFQKGEVNYLKKVEEGFSSPFSLSRLSTYDFSFINLFIPLGLIKIRLLRTLTAFIGILIFMAALYKKRGAVPSLLFGFIFALNPITIYYFVVEEKFSLLFAALSIFFYLFFLKNLNKNVRYVLGFLILLYCFLLEQSFILLIIGFIIYVLLKKINFSLNLEKIKINQIAIYLIVFLVIVFFSFRILNRDFCFFNI